MGFDRCRWVAVHHGPSKAGGDHVHVVVDLVGEDGRAADTWNDRPRAQQVCGELEREHGLRVVEGRQLGLGSRGFNAAEVGQAQRLGKPEPARDYLERVVRASASEASTEHDFVSRLRERGVTVRPRYAPGTKDVAGYSVRVGESPWYGGGQLARDLTLPRLREQWASPAPQTADQAAHHAAGRLAAASLRAERGAPGPMAQESRELARYAQTRAGAGALVLPLAVAQLVRERIRAAEREAQRAEEYLRDLDHEPRARRHQARDRGPELDL